MRRSTIRGPVLAPIFCTAALLLFPSLAFAASTGMPWESPLSTIATSLQGPVLFSVSAIGIVGCAVGFLVAGPGHGLLKAFLTVGLVISIAAAASRFFLPLLGITGGATI